MLLKPSENVFAYYNIAIFIRCNQKLISWKRNEKEENTEK